MLSLPVEARASAAYGVSGQYQWNQAKTDTANSSAQEKFSFFFNLNTKTSSRLSLSGTFKFDVTFNKNNPGGSSTELQPNIDLRLTSNVVQLGVGYREVIRNESVLSGDTNTNLVSDSREAYVDTGFRTGRLPDIRLRYSLRDEKQSSNDSPVSNTKTNEFRASMNYKLGIFTAVADYLKQSNTDNIGLTTGDQTQITSQLGMNKAIGTKTSLSLRENYNYSDGASNGATSSKSYSSVSEGRLNYNPFKGSNVSTNYIYRLSNDIFAGTGSSTEKTWFTSANYSLPKFLKFYGSYNLRQTDASDTATDSTTTIYGVNFSHNIGKLSISSRYEKNIDSSVTTAGGAEPVNTRSTRDNIDWQLASYITSYLNMGLSESYVKTTTSGLTSTNDHYRLKANIGPVKNLALGPYIDYTIDTPTGSPRTVTTQMVVPATYRLPLSKKLDMSFTDNYNWSKTDSSGASTIATTNSASTRLNYVGPFPSTTLSGDATFSTLNTTGGTTSTTSTYNLRANWLHSPHAVNLNYRYQTGSSTTPSSDYTFQYALSSRLNKLQFSMQARYEYTVTNSTPKSTAQSVYMVVNIRK